MWKSLTGSYVRRDIFRQYIAQDAYYLEAFAASYSTAISKAAGLPVHVVSTLNELLAGVAEEVILHKRYAQVCQSRKSVSLFKFADSTA